VNATPAPDTDAALVLGMASTALPFARSPEAEAERWLRILRLHGRAGFALQALGVSEAPLEPSTGEQGARPAQTREDRDVIAAVTDAAARLARERGARALGTSDVLLAVMEVYGADFERVLRAHGTDRDEVLERIGADMNGAPEA
jgi:hypothetical protein